MLLFVGVSVYQWALEGVSYLLMQNVRPAYNQLITGFGLKWGEEF